MLYIVTIASHGEFYDFMARVVEKQMEVHPNFKQYLVYAKENQEEDIIVDRHIITVKGKEGVRNESLLKIKKAMEWMYNAHPDMKYIVKTTLSTYFNVDNTIKELGSIDNFVDGPPTFFGTVHGFGYGHWAGWNRSGIKKIIESDISEQLKYNKNEDAAFSDLSIGMRFVDKISHTKLDVYQNFTGLIPFKPVDGWVLYKQKGHVTRYRDLSDRYKYLRFIKETDRILFDSLESKDKEINIQDFTDCLMCEIDLLFTLNQLSFIGENFKFAIEYIDYLSQDQIHRLIVYILRMCGGYTYLLDKIKPFLREQPHKYRSEIHYLTSLYDQGSHERVMNMCFWA